MSERFWDEDRWEAFLREQDARLEQLMEHFFAFVQEHPIPTGFDPDASARWQQALAAYLAFRGWPDAEQAARLLGALERGDVPLPYLPDVDDADLEDALVSCEHDGLYQTAHGLARDALEWAYGQPATQRSSSLVQFCSSLTQIPGDLVRGQVIGSEREHLGGQIACLKRALWHANDALDALHELGTDERAAGASGHFAEPVFELRNGLALRVQSLRERLDQGWE